MSRIHEALRKASQEKSEPLKSRSPRAEALLRSEDGLPPTGTVAERIEIRDLDADGFGQIIRSAREIPFNPPADSLLLDPMKPQEAPAEEFRTLRTRLNHLQSTQSLRTLVLTSPSPAEGKSFVATNVALAQAQLPGKRVLLADFDFRQPNIHNFFQ